MYELSTEELAAYEQLHRDEWRRVSDRDLQDELDYAEREIAELESYDAIKDGMLTIWDYAGSYVYRRRLIREEISRRKRFGQALLQKRPSLVEFAHTLKARCFLPEYLMHLGHVPKRHANGMWTMCCPFHTDYTPSFTIWEKPLSHFFCFSCGIKGDVFDFTMTAAITNSWYGAVKEVADYIGVPLPTGGPKPIWEQYAS